MTVCGDCEIKGPAAGAASPSTFRKELANIPPKKQIDEAALLKMVQDGVPQEEIRTRFGFRTSTQLKVAYTNALMNAGQVPPLARAGEGREGGRGEDTVTVNKRGSLVLARSLVERLGLKEGDAFSVEKVRGGLSFRSRAPRPVVRLRKKTRR